MPENTELIVIENPELKAVVEANASIGLTKAQAHAVAFAPFMNKIHELSKALSSIDKNNPSEIDAKIARRCRLDLVPNRTGADKKKKELKESLVSEEKVIDALFNVIKHTERKAKAEKEKQDAILAEQQKQNELKLKAEREAKEKLEKEIQAQKDEEIRKENERILAEKKALLAPDKEKLVLLSKAFQGVQLPELKTNEASEILEKIGVLQQKIVTYILEQSDKL